MKAKNMDEAVMFGRMAANMMETGLKTGLKGMELILGLMGDSILDHGRTIICMVMVCILGKTEEGMRDTTKWTKNTDSESINGLMGEDMKGTG